MQGGGCLSMALSRESWFKFFLVFCFAIGGLLALFFVYNSWGIVSLREGITFVLITIAVSFAESYILKRSSALGITTVLIVGLGLFYGPNVVVPAMIGRGVALYFAVKTDEVNPLYKWGKESLAYTFAFIFLSHLTGTAQITVHSHLYLVMSAFVIVLPTVELLGAALWKICQNKSKANFMEMTVLTVTAVLESIAAPFLVLSYLKLGMPILIAGVLLFYFAGVFLKWFYSQISYFVSRSIIATIMDCFFNRDNWKEDIRDILLILQSKLPSMGAAMFAAGESEERWHFLDAVGSDFEDTQLISSFEKIPWKQLLGDGGLTSYLQQRYFVRNIVVPYVLITGKSVTGVLIVTGAPLDMDEAIVKNLQGELGQTLAVLARYAFMQMEREESHQKIQELNEHLKQTNAQLIHSSKISTIGQMAAGVSHEINNPIGAILANAQFLEMFIQGETERESLENIIIAARRCRDITQKLLNYAREETVQFTEVNLNEVVETTVSMLQHSFSLDRVRLQKELTALPPARGNFNELAQIVTNLLINAKDAIQSRKLAMKEGVVQVRTRAIEGYVILEVKDNGIGMSDHVIGKIFHPFFTTKEIGKGTGMGLSICKGIVERHNGEILVNSKEGKGSTIVVKLPVMNQGGSN